MSDRPVTPPPAPIDRRAALVGGALLAVFAAVAIGLLVLALGAQDVPAQADAGSTPAGVDGVVPRAAPDLDLVDQRGEPFELTSLAGHPVLVFFGYTHCPDVCPATVGVLNEVLADAGPDVRARVGKHLVEHADRRRAHVRAVRVAEEHEHRMAGE